MNKVIPIEGPKEKQRRVDLVVQDILMSKEITRAMQTPKDQLSSAMRKLVGLRKFRRSRIRAYNNMMEEIEVYGGTDREDPFRRLNKEYWLKAFRKVLALDGLPMELRKKIESSIEEIEQI